MAVLSLPDVKAHLNITGSSDDAELMQFTARAQAAVESRVGPLEATSASYRIPGATRSLSLPRTPVISLTSITPVQGTALNLAELYVDPIAGTVSYNNGGWFPWHHYDVVYSAGRSSCPDDLVLAVVEMVRHLWDTQRGGTVRPSRGGGDSYSNTLPGAAYAFPFRVEQLLAPHLQSGFA